MNGTIMKKTTFLLLILMSIAVSAAETVEINGVYYNLIDKINAAEVTYGNWNPNIVSWEEGRYEGNVVIPETISHNGKNYSVTSIGEQAFHLCFLTSVTIPNSVTSIGRWAFGGCDNLESIDIPNGVATIGSCAFGNCRNLSSISIGEGLNSVGDYAFPLVSTKIR